MNGIDFLYMHLTHKLSSEYALVSADASDSCTCCGRKSINWMNTQYKTVGSYSGQVETHCISCQSLYHGSFNKIGHEGYRGENPVAMKLGMLKGCGLLLTENKSVLYAPGKYHRKFLEAPDSIFDEVVDMGGKRVILDVLKRSPEPPFLFILNFGVKKGDLVQNLNVTDSVRNLKVCSDSECIEIPNEFIHFQQALTNTSSKDFRSWIELFKRSCSSYLSVEDVTAFNTLTTKYPDLYSAVRKLPADPHLRLKCAFLAEESM